MATCFNKTMLLPKHTNRVFEKSEYSRCHILRFASFFSYLPATPCLPVVREVVTDPLIDLTQCHLLLWRAVDSKCDEAGVAVWWFAVFVLLHLFLVQCGVRIQ